MTTKATEKAQPREEPYARHSQEAMRAAYQCHTLAQMIFSQIAATRPWLLHATRPPNWPMAGSGPAPWTGTWRGIG